MRDAMGGDATLICKGLGQFVLPAVCRAVETEAQAASGQTEPAWHATQVLFATLKAALPSADSPTTDALHPAAQLWKEKWSYVEAALLHWPRSSTTDQPAAAAADALAAAAAGMPGVLPEASSLLARTVAKHQLPELELQALRKVCGGVRCPPLDATRSAEVLASAISGCAEALLTQQAELIRSPATLAAFFDLMSDSLRDSPAGTAGMGLWSDQLRPKLLAQSTIIGRCLALVPLALPDCVSEGATVAMLRFMTSLVGNDDQLSPQAPQRAVLVAMLPELCASLCHALATLQHLAELDGGLAAAADFLLRVSAVFPGDLPGALSAGMGHAHVAAWSAAQLQRHMSSRASWPKKHEWLEELQHIVCELQREHRKVSH